jgi:hypothetical protein
MKNVIHFIKKSLNHGNDIGTEQKEITPSDKEKWKMSMKYSKSLDELVSTQDTMQFELEFQVDYDEGKSG